MAATLEREFLASRRKLSRKKATLYGKELEKIEAQHGVIKPKYVLDVARDRNNPMHDYFEWNNIAAAEAFRLHQAAVLIRTVKVRVTIEPMAEQLNVKVKVGHTQTVRAFSNVVTPEGERGYVSTDRAMRDPSMRDWLFNEAELAASSRTRTRRPERRTSPSLVR
jgi:hypothetical protein